jgi:hypothetical protein
MFRFTIRDVLWLTVVVGLAVGWWAEFRARRVADARYDGARQSMQQTAELLRVSIVEKDGKVVALKGANYVPCPECDSTIYVDDLPVQSATHDTDGNAVKCWRKTGMCGGCRKRFAYVLMPDNVPGYMTWKPLSETQHSD